MQHGHYTTATFDQRRYVGRVSIIHDIMTPSQPTIFVEKDALNMLFQPIPVFWDLQENFGVDCHLKNIWKDCKTTTEVARSCIWTQQKTSWYATRRSYPDSWSVSLVTSSLWHCINGSYCAEGTLTSLKDVGLLLNNNERPDLKI